MNGLRAHLYSIAAAATLAAGAPLFAQSVSDFRLPAGQASPAPRVQGPVDPETPRVPPSAAPTSAPAPLPVPTVAVPVRVPAAGPSAAETPVQRPPRDAAGPAAPTRADRAAERGRAAPPPVAGPAPQAGAGIALPPPTAAPVLTPDLEQASAPAITPAPVAAPAASGSSAWWWLLGLGGLAALGAVVFTRRRAAAGRAYADEAEIRFDDQGAEDGVAAIIPPAPVPVSPPALAPHSAPTPAPAPAPIPAPAAPVWLALDPVRLSISLVNATLHYELSVANFSPAAIGPLAIAADMIGAHASVPEERQLGLDGAGLELRHEVAGLAPGETLRLKGELRLPLATVQPIRSGAATLLVPLVRLRAEGPGWSLTRVVVVGEAPLAPGGLLRPFRLDMGPRIFGEVGQREVANAA